jgi:hypothetical protein
MIASNRNENTMKTSIETKFGLTVMSVICYALFMYLGYLTVMKFDPFGEFEIFEKTYLFSCLAYGGILAFELIHLYCDQWNPDWIVKTAIIGLLIFPFLMAVFCYFGILILIGVFLWVGVAKLL